jgi:glucokinase
LPANRFLAVDVGGSSVKSGFVDTHGVAEQRREPVAGDLDGLVRQLVRVHGEAGADAWGVSIAGLVDADRGVVRYATNLPLRDAPLVELLAAEAPAPCVFANDLVAATVGEAGGGTLALLQAGTGIAGRFAVNGRVPGSASAHAGEVGHLRFRPGGLPCRCGRLGCAEAYGAWGGILDRHAAAGRSRPTPASLLAAAAEDEWARWVLDDALAAIGFAASALVASWDPATLRVGGGLAAAWGGTLLEAIRGSLAENVLPAFAAATRVEPARHGDAAALVGLFELSRTPA